MIDLHWIVGVLLACASAAIAACVPAVTAYVIKHLGVASSAALSTDIDNLVQAGARIALDELGSAGAHNVDLTVKNAAVAKGVTYVLGIAQTAMAASGLTTESLTSMIGGEVSKLLATPPAAAPVTTSLAAPQAN